MAQMVKYLLAIWETRVQSLGQEDPREEQKNYLCLSFSHLTIEQELYFITLVHVGTCFIFT